MDINNVNKLIADGTLTELYKGGFIGSKIFEYKEIYLYIDAQITTRKISQNAAVKEAEDKFKRSRSYILGAIKTFRAK